MDAVATLLDRLQETVESARSMPMSASCVVNRAEVLALVDELRLRLPDALAQAREVLGDREGVVEDGRREAQRIVDAAAQERSRMVATTDLVSAAQREADELREQAREAAEAMRIEVEDYVDAKLANFEIVLGKTLEAVERGRQKLAGRHELDALREPEDDPLPG